MSGYVSQGIATKRYGVTFRSKLEAVWAEAFQECKTPWTYLDASWTDFEIDLGDRLIHAEIKPQAPSFLFDAVNRAWSHSGEWHLNPKGERTMMFILGEPQGAETWMVNTLLSCNRIGIASNVMVERETFWVLDGAMMATQTLVNVAMADGYEWLRETLLGWNSGIKTSN
jgi:hypothetical protein